MVSLLILESGSSRVVIQMTLDPKVAGLNLGAADILRNIKMISFVILASPCSIIVEQMTLDLKFAGLNLAAVGTRRNRKNSLICYIDQWQ
jgi:hypothetical protein